MQKKKLDTQKLTVLAILSALVVILQFLALIFKISGATITLTLVPIVIGAALYGIKAGAFLGFIFGLVVFIQGMTGLDLGLVQNMMDENAFLTVVFCFGKAILAGIAAGAVYRLVAKKNDLLASFLAGATAPIVNTGVFVFGFWFFFKETLVFYTGLNTEATGTVMSPVAYLFIGMVGINFLVEFGINMIFAPTIKRVIDITKKSLGNRK